jgi:hypothetical protein
MIQACCGIADDSVGGSLTFKRQTHYRQPMNVTKHFVSRIIITAIPVMAG